MNNTPYLLNAFSLQMLDGDATVEFKEIECILNIHKMKSAIGHKDTANILGVEYNRIDVKLKSGDIAYVVQLIGGRLPEGVTTLPEGFKFKFWKVIVK